MVAEPNLPTNTGGKAGAASSGFCNIAPRFYPFSLDSPRKKGLRVKCVTVSSCCRCAVAPAVYYGAVRLGRQNLNWKYRSENSSLHFIPLTLSVCRGRHDRHIIPPRKREENAIYCIFFGDSPRGGLPLSHFSCNEASEI